MLPVKKILSKAQSSRKAFSSRPPGTTQTHSSGKHAPSSFFSTSALAGE